MSEEVKIFLNNFSMFLNNLKKNLPKIKFVAEIVKAIYILRKNQFVIWYVDMNFFAEIVTTKDIDNLILEYYRKDNYNILKDTVAKCEQSDGIKNYKELFLQCLSAYRIGYYHLATLGLLSILDGLLSTVSSIDITNIEIRYNEILKKLGNNPFADNLPPDYLILYTLGGTIKDLSKSHSFSAKEPQNLNRHWLIHGRSSKNLGELDFIKILNIVYGVLYLYETDTGKQF